MAERELVRCRFCSKLVFWVKTVNGKPFPLDPLPKAFEPEPERCPNVILDAEDRARILKRHELGDLTLMPRYVSHWATCPYSRKVKEFTDKRRAKASARASALEAGDRELEQLRLETAAQTDQTSKGWH